MFYQSTTHGTFVDRPNRFVAHVLVNDSLETVHVKNTGRCRELLLPGCDVILAESSNESRKTKYDLIAVDKKGLGWVNIDSQAPNYVVKEWLEAENELFPSKTLIKPEYTFGNSRVDFYLECPGRKILLEVKGCTLEREFVGYFPDAPTERGVKHLHELSSATLQGYECFIAFVIAMPKVTKVLPNIETHPEFGVALKEAKEKGVRVLFLPCFVSENELKIEKVLEDLVK